ncbi:MAG: hypothetical protein KDC34_02530 [Saprospiraceae bacterium]|nr:hypothetical protein [Saprospiraceae bacterium]
MSVLKNIKEVAPFLADHFIDLEKPLLDIESYSTFLNHREAHLGVFKKYLICKLHDSWILGTERTHSTFKLKLNDFTTHVFADALIKRKNLQIEHDQLVFPLELTFHGIQQIECFEVDENGTLTSVEYTDAGVYLHEQVTQINQNQIDIVLNLWKYGSTKKERNKNVIVKISADKLLLSEQQDKAWNHLFSAKYDNYYDYFKAQFDTGRYISDYTQ